MPTIQNNFIGYLNIISSYFIFFSAYDYAKSKLEISQYDNIYLVRSLFIAFVV